MIADITTLRIIVVEDDPADFRLLVEALAGNGISDVQINHCQTLTQGVEAARATEGCAVFIDLNLPDSMGVDTVRTFRAEVPCAPLIVLTGCQEQDIAMEALQAGAQEYLNKNEIAPALITRILRHAVDRKHIENAMAKQNEHLEELVAERTAQLRTANEQLRAEIHERRDAERLKDDFVSMVSHELRTPLSIAQEGVSLLEDEIAGPLNERQARIVSLANSNIQRLRRIIEDLLSLSKMEAGKLELHRRRVDFVSLMDQVHASMASQAEMKGLVLKTQSPKRQLLIHADPDRIVEVLMNLVGNAIKFTEQGWVAISVTAADGHLECAVEDTGTGIAPDDLGKLFNKFVQVGKSNKASRQGAGLGLCISKNIVEMHEGRIWVTSQADQGARFCFTLPLEQEWPRRGLQALKTRLRDALKTESAADTVHSEASGEKPTMNEKILLIDDTCDFAEMIQLRLEANDFRVVVANRPLAGLEKAQSEQPDLVLLDVMMPELDGFSVLARLKQETETKNIPVVMLTAKGESKALFRAMDMGAADYLIKPCQPRILIDTIRKHLNRHGGNFSHM